MVHRPQPDFYPRSPCGERRVTVLGIQHRVGISIHALLAESDFCFSVFDFLDLSFLSTLSLRRATYDTYAKVLRVNISIHALLAESDWPGLLARPFFLISIHALLAESDVGQKRLRQKLAISIHALLAESDMTHTQKFCVSIFLSTLSLRRATGRAFWPGLSF